MLADHRDSAVVEAKYNSRQLRNEGTNALTRPPPPAERRTMMQHDPEEIAQVGRDTDVSSIGGLG